MDEASSDALNPVAAMANYLVTGAGSIWNANSWHWESRKYNKWCEDALRKKLLELKAVEGPLAIKVTEISTLTIEASAVIRKGKKFISFEVTTLLADWQGFAPSGAVDRITLGSVGVSEVSSDEVSTNFPVKVTLKSISGGATAYDARCFTIMNGVGAAALRTAVREVYSALIAHDTVLEAHAIAMRDRQKKLDAEAAENVVRAAESRAAQSSSTSNSSTSGSASLTDSGIDRAGSSSSSSLASSSAFEQRVMSLLQSASIATTRSSLNTASSIAASSASSTSCAVAAASPSRSSPAAIASSASPNAAPTSLSGVDANTAAEPAGKPALAPQSDASTVAESHLPAPAALPIPKPPTTSQWNATGFHWEEHSLTGWARDRLTQLLRGVAIVFPGGSVRMVEVELTGTASFSTRRGKSFIFFEFAISCKWEGELVNDDGDVTGTGDGELNIPDIDQDSGDNFEVVVSAAEDGGQTDAKLQDLFRRRGVPLLRKKVSQFVDELKRKSVE